MADAPGLDRDADAARKLAQAGRFREAVTLGQAANRRNPDPALECELRDWRHRGFYENAHGEGRQDWPPRIADPRPDIVNQIPEIQREQLNAEVLGGALHHHGSLIVRNLLPRERMASYIDGIEEAFAARAEGEARKGSAYKPLEPVNGHNLTLERGFVGHFTVLTVDAPKFLARWVDEIHGCGVVEAVEAYLGERPALSANKATLYRLPNNPGSAWHQDGAFLGEGIRTVNLWVACTECGIDAPGLDIVPWRLNDIVSPGTEGAEFTWSVSPKLVDEMLGPTQMSTPHFKPGDAMLFDQLCLHRTAVRPNMTRGRYAIETWMFAPSHYHSGAPLII
jgi:hypothetical protein